MELSGKIYKGDFVSKIYYEGITFPYKVHVPEYDGKFAINVTHDGLTEADAYAMEELAQTGEAPYCITVGVMPGIVPNGLGEGVNRRLRRANYDVVSSEYPDFIVEELLPYLIKEYDLNIYEEPDMHMVSGNSSGGISAWNIAWKRNDYFRRMHMTSPTFSDFSGGGRYPVLMRKCEVKPIRVFMEFSETEPNDYQGNSYCAGLEAKLALEFAGYDMMCDYHPGEGHGSRYRNREQAVKRMRFVWKNWKTDPIVIKKMSPRMEQMITTEGWEQTSKAFPKKAGAVSCGLFSAAGTYTADKTAVYFTTADGRTRKVADGYSNITAVVMSADKKRLYISDLDRDCVYTSLLLPDGSLQGKFKHAVLHNEPEFVHPGARDLCTSVSDRAFAVTEIGIQSVRSFGLIDVIISLPFGKIPEKIEFGTGEEDYLYALADGVVYRRKILDGGRPLDTVSYEPKYISYFD